MAAVAESFFGNLSSSRDAHHLRRASVLHCRALQEDGCYAEPPVDSPSAKDNPSSLRDLCLNAVIQGTTLTQLKNLFHAQMLPSIMVKELLAMTFHLSKSPAKIFTILSAWPDKRFSLIHDVAEFKVPGVHSKYLSINAFNSMALVDTVENSLDKLNNFQNQIVGALTEFRSWGRDSPIETFDLSGFPISSSAVRAFGILSRLQIPQDWPQVTRTILVDLSFETVETERVLVMLKRKRSKMKTSTKTLFKVSISRLYFFRPFKTRNLSELWPLFSGAHLRGLSLRFAYLTNDGLREDFPGVIRFQNLTSLDLSSSTLDLSRKQRHSANKHRNVSQAIESINYVLKNLSQLSRLDLSECVLTDNLSAIFQDVSVKFRFLSFSGCRLSNSDIQYLCDNSNIFVASLVELNLGHNSLHRSLPNVTNLFEKCSKLLILDLEAVDFSNEDLSVVILCIVKHLHKIECLNLSEEMSRQNIWTPDVISDKVLRPLMTSVPTLVGTRDNFPMTIACASMIQLSSP